MLPVAELARRFSIEAVGHSAGVFDEEKLAWVDRHYLRGADNARLALLAIPYLRSAGFVGDPDHAGVDYITSVVPMATGSVDRLEQVPARLSFLFRFDPREALKSVEVVAEVLAHEGAREVVDCLARELSGAPRLLDRERFRVVVNAVKQQTGQKAKGLFHPIRVALTGEAGGPELDVAVPAIDAGASLPANSRCRRGAWVPRACGGICGGVEAAVGRRFASHKSSRTADSGHQYPPSAVCCQLPACDDHLRPQSRSRGASSRARDAGARRAAARPARAAGAAAG